jgi:hypothetical protein
MYGQRPTLHFISYIKHMNYEMDIGNPPACVCQVNCGVVTINVCSHLQACAPFMSQRTATVLIL